MVRHSILERIFNELADIRRRLDQMEKTLLSWRPQPIQASESMLLLLPDHLRKTYLAVASQGECNATDVSILTGRARAIESLYLNNLVTAGWLLKRKKGRTVVFHLSAEEVEHKPQEKRERLVVGLF